jgi:hypothetical protein
MRIRTRGRVAGALVAALVLGACGGGALTLSEAREALEEVVLAAQAEGLAASSVEVATDFTIGGAVEDAALEIRTFLETQLPCAEVTVTGATLTVTYGARAGSCTYRGHTFTGHHTIAVASAAAGELAVDHTWSNLSDGVVRVSGTAHVTWSAPDASRRVVHDLTWARIADGRTVTGTGDRTQTALPAGWSEGIRVTGTRQWTSPGGTWDLDAGNVELRWIDPVPQSGSYMLATPFDKTLTLTFSRVDADTIAVAVRSGGVRFTFKVSPRGTVTQ